MIDDVLIVGAGPAGAVAATVLARAGVQVRVVDRATFPREKLCGDTLNPGTLALLRRLRLSDGIEAHGLRVDGMLVTGEGGVAIEGRYPPGFHGCALTRSDLDWLLVQQAVRAGARFEPGVAVHRAIVTGTRSGRVVSGVEVGSSGTARALGARITIAADGRRSPIAFGLGLARHPVRPRRWAVGAYFEGPTGTSTMGEMHIRRGRYIGVAPVPGGLTNVCVVQASGAGDCQLRDPTSLLHRALAEDAALRDRFAGARQASPVTVLGPLAVDVTAEGVDGLLLAGDAAGFIDPMTGDGLRFAVRGGELAAAAALVALAHGWKGVHARLEAARRQEFAGKWRFNRALRSLVAAPSAVRAAGIGARFAPGVVRAIIARAGDCDVVA